jgi:hypothetical protein
VVISHRYRLIFIKTAKTAGTSIEVFLSPLCGDDDVFTPFAFPEAGHQPRNYRGFFNPLPELRIIARTLGWRRGAAACSLALRECALRRRLQYMHLPAWQIRERVAEEVWGSYFRFCVERNPWDKVVSGWHYTRGRYDASLSFEDYLDFCARCHVREERAAGVFPINFRTYVDPVTNTVLPDQILKYERLDEDLAAVFGRLGVPFETPLRIREKGQFQPNRRHYQEYYTKAQRSLVARLFAEEIELMGYSFT